MPSYTFKHVMGCVDTPENTFTMFNGTPGLHVGARSKMRKSSFVRLMSLLKVYLLPWNTPDTS
jgi:hypothetical protein